MMEAYEYQELAMRTNDRKHTERLQNMINEGSVTCNEYPIAQILNGCLGLSGEVGEFNDMIKKFVFHEARLESEHVQKELGDILWYIALICDAFNFDLDSIMKLNIDKLKARYPEGFDVCRSADRAEDDV